jgi:CheY-like chemotaxis protein
VSDVIVLVDDSDEDVAAIRRALGRSHPDLVVEHLPTAEGLVARLGVTGGPRPMLVLLDLNLPGVGGRDALKALRTRPDLADIPLVMFSSSADRRDVDRAYADGAHGYLVKPVSFALLHQALDRTVSYWRARTL